MEFRFSKNHLRMLHNDPICCRGPPWAQNNVCNYISSSYDDLVDFWKIFFWDRREHFSPYPLTKGLNTSKNDRKLLNFQVAGHALCELWDQTLLGGASMSPSKDFYRWDLRLKALIWKISLESTPHTPFSTILPRSFFDVLSPLVRGYGE